MRRLIFEFRIVGYGACQKGGKAFTGLLFFVMSLGFRWVC